MKKLFISPVEPVMIASTPKNVAMKKHRLMMLMILLSLTIKLGASNSTCILPDGWKYSDVWLNGSRVEVGVNEDTVYIPPYYYAGSQDGNTYHSSVVTTIKGYYDPNAGWMVKAPKDKGGKTGLKRLPTIGPAYDWNEVSPGAFKNCTAMKKLVLPPTIKSIEQLAFENCEIDELVCMATTPPMLQRAGSVLGSGDSFGKATIKKIVVPKGTLSSYKSADQWKDYPIEEGAEVYSSHQMIEHNGAWYEVINGEASLVNSDDMKEDMMMPENVSGLINGEWKTFPVKNILPWSVGNDIIIGPNILEIPDDWYNGGTLSFTANHPIYRQIAPNVVTNTDGKTALFVFKTAIVPHGVTAISNNAMNHCSTAYLPTTLTFIGKQSTKATLYFTSELPPSTTMSSYSGKKYAPEAYLANYKEGVFKTTYQWDIPADNEYYADNAMTAYWNPQTKKAILKNYIAQPEDVSADGFIMLPIEFNYTDNESCQIENYDLYLDKSSDVDNINKIVVPEGIKTFKIKPHRLNKTEYFIKEISLPSTLDQCYQLSPLPGLSVIQVSEDNPKFDSRDNCNAVIETATNTLLTGCGNTVIPNSVEHIADSAFNCAEDFPELFTIPASIKSIGKMAFWATRRVVGDNRQAQTYQIEFAPTSIITNIGEMAFKNANISKVILPNSVVTIGSEAFEDCYSLEEVAFGNSLKSIGCCAFSDTKLSSLTLPDALETIGDWAFYKTALTTLTLPDALVTIGNGCFGDITSLKNITFGSSLKSIGNNAFYSCDATSLTFPNSLETIGEECFYGAINLKEIYLGNSLKKIGNKAFSNCLELQSLTLPNSVTHVGYEAFAGCNNIQSFVFPMEKVEYIGREAFYTCPAPEELHLPETLTEWSINSFNLSELKVLYTDSPATAYLDEDDKLEKLEKVVIGDKKKNTNVFYRSLGRSYAYGLPNIPNLKEVILGKSVEEISDYAFLNLPITSIILPKSLKSIGKNAFQGCKQLVKTEISDLAAWCAVAIKTNDYSNPLSVSQKLVVDGEEVTDLVIPEGVAEINKWAFYGCKSLTSLTVPKSLKKIDYNCFQGCDKLTRLNIPDIASWCKISIGGYYVFSSPERHLFKDGAEILDLEVPEGVDSIQPYTFYNCKGLKSAKLANSVTNIGYYAFQGCSGLNSLTIGNSVTSIGNGAFIECVGLTSVTIPNSVTSIEDNVFRGCSGLTSVTIGNSLTSIGYWAFSNCKSLSSIVVETGNTKYDSRGNCNAIIETSSNTLVTGCKNTVIPDNVLTIGRDAFDGCANLTDIKFPDNVRNIEEHAFRNCSGLTSIAIGNGVNQIGACAFEYCSGLKSIYISNSVKYIGNYAFEHCNALKDVYCYARQVPSTGFELFYESYVDSITLHVPTASIEAYSTATEWNKFKKIVAMAMPTYQLIYIVDGEVYKTLELEYGETITPEPNPSEKEGYTFSGWSEIPETMPAHDVTVYATYTSGIAEIIVAQGVRHIYGPDGKPRKELQKGLNIVLMCDGMTKKVLVK